MMTKKRTFKASTCRKMEDIPIDQFLSYFIHSIFTLSLLSLFVRFNKISLNLIMT